TRTFSKIHGLAGLRIGYGVSNPQIADVLNRVRQPFNVNTPAMVAAEAALSDDDHIENSRSENTSGLVQIAEGLQKLHLEQIPSVANFIAFDCGRDAMPVYQALLREGVIVRPLGGYGMPNFLRVTVGTSRENERFLQALKHVLKEMADG
ncbi:MAG: pyridoxal phosphate-dependent aminotransferase, partial [Alcanivorax sp.]